LTRLEAVDSMLFTDLFEADNTKPQVIATFMALLELMKTRAVKAFQIEQFGAIRIMKAVIESSDRDTATGNLFG
jgi:chromatin segregation and condensation protein Rec8/ScpA/Scc1 (kleisin family)